MFDSFSDFWHWGDGIFRSIILAAFVCVLFWLAAFLLTKKIAPAIIRKIDEEKHPVTLHMLEGFFRPVNVLLRFLGFVFMFLLLSIWLTSEMLPAGLLKFLAVLPPILYRTIRISIVIAIAWGLIASNGVTSLLLRNARRRLDINMSKSVSRFLAAVFNVLVVALAIVIILSELDYDINGLIAGLGLGGLTIALAAKESAENFFGGLVLITEKPFEIGDYISTNSVEGTVEDINLRSTKIRLSSGSLTVVPNANLSSSPITNWSGVMKKRRARFLLQLEYNTSAKQLKEFINSVQTLLETDPEILNESILVHFIEFGESSLNVQVVYYTALPGMADHLRINERINYGIIQLAQQYKVGFAFPTRTLYIQDTDDSTENVAKHDE